MCYEMVLISHFDKTVMNVGYHQESEHFGNKDNN